MKETKQIHIEYSKRVLFRRNSFYQNDFLIKIGNSSSRVTIFSNQPIYPNAEKNGFEIADKEFAEIMGYSKFDIKDIIIHDLRNRGEFPLRLDSLLMKIIA